MQIPKPTKKSRYDDLKDRLLEAEDIIAELNNLPLSADFETVQDMADLYFCKYPDPPE
jgi:hypothetical protein